MKINAFLFFVVAISSCNSQIRNANVLPDCKFLSTDSTTIINTANLETGKPFIIIYFSPDCEHCQEETDSILLSIQHFESIPIYFITNDPLSKLKVFEKYYSIKKYKNIILGRDYTFAFYNYYKPQHTPYIIIYNKRKEQVAIFDGGGKVNEILDHVND